MSESAEMRPLIIGIGNPLRGDDGLGRAVAEQLSQEGGADWNIQAVYQLTPELAQSMAAASLVIMIDASREGAPGELRIHALSLPARPTAVGSHHTTPEELTALTTGVYGRCPPVVIVTMTGADFGLGERLSSIVAGKLPAVCGAVQEVARQLERSERPDSRVGEDHLR